MVCTPSGKFWIRHWIPSSFCPSPPSDNESVLDHSFYESYYFQTQMFNCFIQNWIVCVSACTLISIWVLRTRESTRSNHPLPKSLSSPSWHLLWQMNCSVSLHYSVNVCCVIGVTLLLKADELSNMSCCVPIRNRWCTAVCLLMVPSDKKKKKNLIVKQLDCETITLVVKFYKMTLINYHDNFAHWELVCEIFSPPKRQEKQSQKSKALANMGGGEGSPRTKLTSFSGKIFGEN